MNNNKYIINKYMNNARFRKYVKQHITLSNV